MCPAGQRLEADDAPLGIHLRLVMHRELVALQCGAHRSLEIQTLIGDAVEVMGEELEVVASPFLRRVHGDIGMLEQGLRILSVIREHRHAEAGANLEFAPGKGHRATNLVQHALEQGDHGTDAVMVS